MLAERKSYRIAFLQAKTDSSRKEMWFCKGANIRGIGTCGKKEIVLLRTESEVLYGGKEGGPCCGGRDLYP